MPHLVVAGACGIVFGPTSAITGLISLTAHAVAVGLLVFLAAVFAPFASLK